MQALKTRRLAHMLPFFGVLWGLGLVPAQAAEQARLGPDSGKPVPRYESLKFEKVNGRAGPGLDYPIAWTYQRKGLPVLVDREDQSWRRIRDPGGTIVWVHARTLAADRSVYVRAPGGQTAELRARPHLKSRLVAQAQPGVIARLDHCAQGWCKIRAKDREGWIALAYLWGATKADSVD